MKKIIKSKPLRDACITFMGIFIITSIIGFGKHIVTEKVIEYLNHSYLVQIAKIAATSVDGDLHQTITFPEQIDSREYKKAITPLAKIIDMNTEYKYIYTVIMKDNQLYFVLDPTPPGDSDGDGVDDKSYIMQEYNDYSPELKEAIIKQKATADSRPYHDQWGYFMSAYAPFYDSLGRFVGIIGLDIDASKYEERISHLERTTLLGEVIAFFVSLAAAIVIFFVRKSGLKMEVAKLHTLRKLKNSERHAQALAKSKGDILAIMSHEIRSPISSVFGISNLLLQTKLDKQQKKYASTIYNSTDSLLSLINDILDYSKIESGKMDVEILEFNLLNLVEDLAHMMEFKIQEKNLDLLIYYPVEIPQIVSSDPIKIKQIILNFLSNAIKFTEIGHVTIEFSLDSKDSRNITIAIIDTGIGLNEEKQQSLFKEYSQTGKDVARRYGGTGLGLSICKKLVPLLGGEVGVTSAEGEGSKFWFSFRNHSDNLDAESIIPIQQNIVYYAPKDKPAEIIEYYLRKNGADIQIYNELKLPDSIQSEIFLFEHQIFADVKIMRDFIRMIKENAKEKNVSYILIASQQFFEGNIETINDLFDYVIQRPIYYTELLDYLSNQKNYPKHHRKSDNIREKKPLENMQILLVDDNPINLEVISSILIKFGADVTSADNGETAFDLASSFDFDLILLDCVMPILDGYQTTRKIRGYEKTYMKQKPTPIFALTAHMVEDCEQECKEAGMDFVLSKPVKEKDLLAAIENILQKTPSSEVDQEEELENSALDSMKELLGERFSDVIKMFIATSNIMIEETEEAINIKNYSVIAAKTHTLKSSCAQFGSKTTAMIFMAMEKNAKNNENIAEIASAMIMAKEEFQKFTIYLEKIINS